MRVKRRTIAASDFKNSCLKVIDEVARQGLAITVTKRGRPLVRVVPATAEGGDTDLLGTIVRESADIFSTGERWDADS